MTTADKTFFGFTGVFDLLNSMFKYNQVNISKALNLAFIMTFILLFAPFLEHYIWSPMWTLFVFYAVVSLDFITAVAASWNEKKFVTQKAIKVPFVMVSYFILFAILHSMGKVVEAFELGDILNPSAFRFLSISVYFMCLFINLLSSLKHMSKLGLIPKAVAVYIERFIDVHKNKMEKQIDSYSEDKEKPEDNGENV